RGLSSKMVRKVGRNPVLVATLRTGSLGAGRRVRMEGNSERLLTPGEVAALFRVDPKTVTRWAASGRISSIRTPGGHRRVRESKGPALPGGDAAATPGTAAPGPLTPR